MAFHYHPFHFQIPGTFCFLSGRRFYMEDLISILSSLEVQSSHLKSDTLQRVLIKIKKIHTKSIFYGEYQELCNKILNSLWTHLKTQLNEFDDQLLCSTCFYTVLSYIEKQDIFLQQILQNIKEELNQHNTENKTNENSSRSTTVSIIYGLLQSKYLTKKNTVYFNVVKDILNSSLYLLIDMSYEYSHYTFIVFKIIVSYKKVLDTEYQNVTFTKCNQIKLLNLVNHNWENPIHGVRNLNKFILQNIILIIDNDIYEIFLEEINTFYWNKAKYLMLSEIIDQHQGDLYTLIKKCNLTEGLLHSLHKPGLVSAGADMYYSLLNKINTEAEWENIFLKEITHILCLSPYKATENFNNYWCIATLKKFPSVGSLLIRHLQKLADSEQKWLSTLCIVKQCNKLNLIKKNWKQISYIEKLIICGIEHCNPYIRILAFDVVCVTNNRAWPSQIEYELILNYLSDNVSSDCTVLRLNLLNSFCNFLCNLQTLHLNNMNSTEDGKRESSITFCEELQEFVMKSLKLKGNYQRRITTIKIASAIFQCFTEIPKKKQKQLKQSNYCFMQYLIDNGNWILFDKNVFDMLINLLSDPADDIRENVLKLLLNYYTLQLIQPVYVNEITENALTKIRSKFFYEINCGQSMFRLIINLLKQNVLESVEVKFKNVDEVFIFAYNELLAEYNLKRNIVESIEEGRQLHSSICILYAVFEISLKTSHKIRVSYETILSLLAILEDVSNQFVWEQGHSTSSDFSKMSDMVQQIIEYSGHKSNNEDNERITGLQQIVLNCLWLNVKASCELASLLIQYFNSDKYLDVCKKSLNIITNVLETSRHKGAIEAAGVALGESIRNLTCLCTQRQLAVLPSDLLKQKLNELILEANNMASVTRRGAGLSIMVHRIVSNDMQKNKPLFHYFVDTLLKTCNFMCDESDNLKTSQNIANEKDLPKAIYIHFLTKIVTDSSLTTEVMYYSSKLAKLAFDNLTSIHWQIRNAALQLYGALIPKLIGQKKASGAEDEVTATVACDEFRTHFPELWIFILNQLKQNDEKDMLQAHSNLIPILNILGNLAKRYNFLDDSKNHLIAENDLLMSLTNLLQSSIYMVRRLTAKCIYNMYTFDDIFTLLITVDLGKENLLHGCLLLLANCYNYYKDMKYQKKFDLLTNRFSTILQSGHHSYLCKELMVKVSPDKSGEICDIHKVMLETRNTNEPGILLWALTIISKYLQNCSWNDMPLCLKLILDSHDYERYCEVLYIRLNSDIDICPLVLIDINNILLAFPKNVFSCVIWKILHKISTLINFDHDQSQINHLIDYIHSNSVSYKLRFMILFLTRVAKDETTVLFISKIIKKLCNAEVSDVDMRMISATANNEIAFKIGNLSDEIKINSVITAVTLLQDEDEDVRNLSVHFYKNITKASQTYHPYICLRSILNAKFLCSLLCVQTNGIHLIFRGLSDLFSSLNSANFDEFNPFVNESKNIYQEPDVVLQLIEKLKDDCNIKKI